MVDVVSPTVTKPTKFKLIKAVGDRKDYEGSWSFVKIKNSPNCLEWKNIEDQLYLGKAGLHRQLSQTVDQVSAVERIFTVGDSDQS